MLAVRKIGRGIGHIEVQEVPEAQAGPEQVVVQVDSAGICGTDLHIYLDEFETALWCERLRMFSWLVFRTPGAPVLLVL